MTKAMTWKLAVVGLVGLAAVILLQYQGSGTIVARKGLPMEGRVEKTDREWQAQLTPEQFQVTRRKGTERAFTGVYWNTKQDGIYACICCGQPLFDAKTKFDSGTGWPSYWQPLDESRVSLVADNGWLMRRTEVTCSRCDAHLGHVFDDGPPPTGQRYCMNSAALKLVDRNDPTQELPGQ